MKTVIEMAKEAGNDDLFDAMQVAFLEQFAELVRADEREKWAQVCDEIDKDSQSQWPKRLATMIRAGDEQ